MASSARIDAQRGRGLVAAEPRRRVNAPDAQILHPRGIVVLVAEKGNDQLRATRFQRLARGSDPAMVDDRGATSEQLRVRSIADRRTIAVATECSRAGQEHASPAEPAGGCGGLVVEVAGRRPGDRAE